MKNKFRLILIMLVTVLFIACDTSLPVPIVGSYCVSEFEEESYGYYYLQLKDDYTFRLYQAGGFTSSKGFLFEGKWEMDMTAYNFKQANGVLSFTDVTCSSENEFAGLIFTPGVINKYRFYWETDKDTARTTLSLESMNRFICGDIATGYLMPAKEFEDILISVGFAEKPVEPEVEGGEVPEGDQSNEG